MAALPDAANLRPHLRGDSIPLVPALATAEQEIYIYRLQIARLTKIL
jgi:hypothetical protein